MAGVLEGINKDESGYKSFGKLRMDEPDAVGPHERRIIRREAKVNLM
jgi:hypothetical protein